MIRLIEALNYRCLRYVRQPLDPFHVLVGPNASGKTTFLDVPAFLGDLLKYGLDKAISERSASIEEIFFNNQGDRFELAVEMEPPVERAGLLPRHPKFVRYEISIGKAPTGEYHIFDEQVILQDALPAPTDEPRQCTLFPSPMQPPNTIMHATRVGAGQKRTVRKNYEKNDNFYSEMEHRKGKGGWAPSIRLGPRKSALAGMPEDQLRFPVSSWLRTMLMDGTQKVMLDSLALRRSSAPGQSLLYNPQGSNLPWVIQHLYKTNPARLNSWIKHIRTALPDITGVTTVELPDTRHRFLQIVYKGGLKVPSWTASDGTLRMLALTLPAFLPGFTGTYLIEEPENGIHPMAMEAVFQALRSAYGAQILLATHSPTILGCAELDQVLCFKKEASGATDIVRGSEHPALRAWQGSVPLPTLYASGVLG